MAKTELERRQTMTDTAAVNIRLATGAWCGRLFGATAPAALIGSLAISGSLLADLSITAQSDNRGGTILAFSGSGDPTESGYNVHSQNMYSAIFFNECVSAGSASACLDTASEWLGFNALGNTTTGFTIDSTLSSQLGGSGTALAQEAINVTLQVAGLSGGATAPFEFSGFIGAATGGATVTVTLNGPGVNQTRNSPGSWQMALDLGNGEYTLQVQADAQSPSGGQASVAYGVSFAFGAPLPTCGVSATGSCFETGPVYCDIAACCEAVCAADPFCCATSWDGICVSGALDLCLPNVPLCDGGSMRFGVADRAEIPSYGMLAPSSEITIEFWQRLDTSTQNTAILCQSDLTNRIVVHTPWLTGNIIFDFGGAFTGGRIEAPAPAGLIGNWHHFAFVASNAGQFMRIYHNGQLLAEKSGANAFQNVDVPMVIADNFNGAIDELRIWNVARTAAQIAADYDKTVATVPSLRVYYRMDSPAETSPKLIDRASAGGHNHATTFGSPTLLDDSPCVFVADLNGDGVVDGADLGLLLNNWGNPGLGDINGDGVVDGLDLGILLNSWG